MLKLCKSLEALGWSLIQRERKPVQSTMPETIDETVEVLVNFWGVLK